MNEITSQLTNDIVCATITILFCTMTKSNTNFLDSKQKL